MPPAPSAKKQAKAPTPNSGTREDSNELGVRLASLRKLNGLTLEQLASRAEITKSYLSKLERGLSSPTIATLLKLARALGLDSEQLIGAHSHQDEIVLVKASDRVPFSRSDEREGYTYEAIAATRLSKSMVPFIMCPPHTLDEGKDLVSHAGEELIFLVAGKMEVVFADRRVRMDAGDAIYFDASIPHRSRSIGKSQAQALVVVSAPGSCAGKPPF